MDIKAPALQAILGASSFNPVYDMFFLQYITFYHPFTPSLHLGFSRNWLTWRSILSYFPFLAALFYKVLFLLSELKKSSNFLPEI
jgi:hypothetical protein